MKTALHHTSVRASGKRRTLLHCFLALCVLPCVDAFAQPTVTTGKSFVNISRPNGGTFLPGDIIEVRATIAVIGGGTTAATRLNNLRYNDTINLTKFEYIDNSLQMISNEGRLQTAYSDNADLDSGHIHKSSGRIRFNIGNSAGAADVTTQGESGTGSGRLWGSGGMRPSFFGSTCIRVYAFRVRIKNDGSVAVGETIDMPAGNFRYNRGSSGSLSSSDFTPYKIRISPDYGLCANAAGSNAIVGESGGTFGSGTAQNRAGGTSFVPLPYTMLDFGANTPNDNYYGLANTTSTDGTVNPNVNYSSGSGSGSRVFGVWDIIGDHTGAADQTLGNWPGTGGYTVVVNASYETNRAFTQNISGLCEDTYYEFSAWFRNICRRCGCDSSGKGSTVPGYRPGPSNDSSGVRPNLNFQIDGEDVYTSGNIAYTGTWVKKGFVFKTKTGQTSMTVTIRNNAPGGGGNDWAIDDIGVRTCLPNMKYSPTMTPTVCQGSPFKVTDTIRSYFDNYRFHRWQTSMDNGVTWTNVSAVIDSTPHYNAALNMYEYWSSYINPLITVADNGRRYRLVIATSTANLTNNSCRTTDEMNGVTLTVNDCGGTLATKFLNFSGSVHNNKSVLKWTVTGEEQDAIYGIQRSADGINYASIATVNGTATSGSDQTSYAFTDPEDLTRKMHYRIFVQTKDNRGTFSRTLQLEAKQSPFAFISVVNPFQRELFFDISTDRNGTAKAELIDNMGKTVKRKTLELREGVNQLSLAETDALPTGIYILRVECGGIVITRRVLKQAH
ncbi:T9SS type A sorting domain-containing protein [Terrimonas sp. NA20]|uniref:T9SS type A sorting domain-containing protein n=1 Tax=Terrimonas ginsenosidimutans TaxID=2908004 RepID=A0ABS9KQN4_9BACT|nr:T9SS type A sorting domain-containing protein [Terrimonas ginsenosidimutans]MCG2614637.1 T9SS type A sorting domain-containing protein [Terrimonas ginsenosidimutans]